MAQVPQDLYGRDEERPSWSMLGTMLTHLSALCDHLLGDPRFEYSLNPYTRSLVIRPIRGCGLNITGRFRLDLFQDDEPYLTLLSKDNEISIKLVVLEGLVREGSPVSMQVSIIPSQVPIAG